ncbi:MAG TPA: PIG-L family deacetylase [Phycisphaerales bacterium]|nr:PIG-L family deacetylase [Phycisphaerales bacterium]HMP36576.1 PIG-L family deacetylase [Phycisphaerales bacterium]
MNRTAATDPLGSATPVRRIEPAPGMPERVPVQIHPDSEAASRAVAEEIAGLIRARAAEGRRAILGLATGSTPQGVYAELVRLHRDEGLSFRNVTSFNLDEYWPMEPEALQSYRRFMREHLFELVDIAPGEARLPDGAVARADVAAHCAAYERAIAAAGGIDLQLLGIGRTGHIGFNEPGSPLESRTRLIALDRVTRMDAASDFFGERNVPRHALTMGVGTILEARRIALLAFGEHKAAIVRRAVEGEVLPSVAASVLQRHPAASFVLDPAAAAELTRVRTPWLLGPIERFEGSWDEPTVRRAVIWLARTTGKAILKLTDEDYAEHHLQELLSQRGGAYEINLEVFRALSRTITGWPGGRPADHAGRIAAGGAIRAAVVPDEPFPKRVVVFSPHPDDDVISMGGTLIRLCEQGHEVHVAYQTSGNIAVWDESALRHADFVREFARAFLGSDHAGGASAVELLDEAVERFVSTKRPGEIDTPELQRIKGLIRRTEARAAARYSGVEPSRIHFLDLPFYETGRVRKRPLGREDIAVVSALLRQVRPHQIYAAGDLSDPHGTHRTCLRAVIESLRAIAAEVTGGSGRAGSASDEWTRECELWLYRGAWQEWGPEEIEMAVPLSPEELRRKRMAIFKHESQKDTALFPGPSDPREFWQRAEDRNRATAKLYDALGLAEYEGIEGFVRAGATGC